MNKKTLLTAIIVIVAIAIVYALVQSHRNKNQQASSNSADQSQNSSTAGTTSDTGGTAGKLSYTAAVKKYGLNRIQFDSTCQAHPNMVTFKSGTQVMFDNRSSVTRKINFNGTVYTIARDDYTVITMRAAKYPTTVLVDCDNSQNVATVLIQK